VKILSILFLCFLSFTVFAEPTFNPQLVLTNQYGETTNNAIRSGTTFVGGKVPANTIVSNLSASSAFPSGASYSSVSAKLLPLQLLTGYASGAGVVAGTDNVLQAIQKINGNQSSDATHISQLQNGQFTLQTESISSAGALSTTVAESLVTNASGGSYAVTLAAPSSQDGQIKIIQAVTTMSHTVTLALTNVKLSGAYTPTGTTTLTFTNVGDSAIFIAVGGKWIYIGGQAVAS
jgi:hypothetical protein